MSVWYRINLAADSPTPTPVEVVREDGRHVYLDTTPFGPRVALRTTETCAYRKTRVECWVWLIDTLTKRANAADRRSRAELANLESINRKLNAAHIAATKDDRE